MEKKNNVLISQQLSFPKGTVITFFLQQLNLFQHKEHYLQITYRYFTYTTVLTLLTLKILELLTTTINKVTRGGFRGGGAEGAAAPPFSSSEIYFLSKYTIIL